MNSNLIIFDIDGTLTESVQFDSQIFTETFKNYFKLSEINNNWHEYRYSTDSGFTLELFEKYFSRPPSALELNEIKQKFFNSLKNKIIDDANCCKPILGADQIFEKIKNLGNWDLAIATGCWLTSAIIKLTYANLPFQNIPLASGDDHIERSEIINTVIRRSQLHYKQECYKNVIYVGDRLWDYHAANQLGLNFIGVGDELIDAKIADILVVHHYQDERFFAYLKGFSF